MCMYIYIADQCTKIAARFSGQYDNIFQGQFREKFEKGGEKEENVEGKDELERLSTVQFKLS